MRAKTIFIAAVAVFALNADAETVRIRGSALAFERLSSLRDFLERSAGDVEIDWTGYGSETAVPALLEGTADLVIVSRELEDFERELLTRSSVEVAEHILALDGLAIVVHPSNPVETLALSQLRSIFTGSLVAWHGVGGPDSRIRLVMPSRYSGDRRMLERHLFGSAERAEGIEGVVEIRETPVAIVESVAKDPSALGVVSMSVDRRPVKTLPIRADDGAPAFLPTVDSVERGEYPLGRAILLYRPTTFSEPLRKIVSSLLLTNGQAEIARAGLVALPADRAIFRALPSASSPTVSRVGVSRVGFPFGTSRLNREARRRLDDVAEAVSSSGGEIWVTGHTELQEAAIERDLSAERAAAAAAYLRERGLEVTKAEGRGAFEPVASAETPDGRRENRRVDVWILPRR
jgi:phosphate transport system substrate-binding protein